jgi:hypothetical protein
MSHLVSKKKAEKEKSGLLKQIHGGSFETKVLNYYVDRGFSVRHGIRNRYGQFDLIATREEGRFRKKRLTLIVECKKYAKNRVPFKEFVKFVRKCNQYYNHYAPIVGGLWEGVFAYSGQLDKEIRSYLNSIPENEWIRLQRFGK